MAFDPPLTLDEIRAALGTQFEPLELLKPGGQGVVAKAVRVHDGDAVALKIYSSDQLAERAAREIEALARIKTPVLVELLASGVCEVRGMQCIYTATTFIAGQNLSVRVSSNGPLDVREVVAVGRDVAVAIGCLWRHRIVHRDVKPDNIMLTSSGTAVLIDLGVARHLALKTLTTIGKTWGTQGYLSPEQIAGASLTCKSDVFALGVVIQECLLGRHPTRHRQEDLLMGGPSTAALRGDLPPGLVRLVDQMVDRSAVRRPLPEGIKRTLTEFLTGGEE